MIDTYKGVRDFYPEDQRVQNYMFTTMRQVSESYGYEEYNASVLEPTELYAAKSSDEIVNEQTYTFKDRGDRSVTLRPEMTPTVARMVAARKRELGYPARWYCIQNFFRYDRQQRGRLREFWQLNADIFGVPGVEGDVEVMELAYRTLTAFGATPKDFKFLVGSRSILKRAFSDAELTEEQEKQMRILLDKRAKMEPAAFLEAREKITPKPVEDMLGDIDGPLAEAITLLKARGIEVIYDPSVVRGFEYYTDIVFEVFDTNPENARSILGGGRYDSLIEKYGSEPVAAVGFALGDVVMKDFLTTHALMPKLSPSAQLYLAPVGTVNASGVADILRTEGVNVALGMPVRTAGPGGKHDKVGDHIKAASKLGISYFAAYGEVEEKSNELTIKELASGTETKVGIDKVAEFFIKHD